MQLVSFWGSQKKRIKKKKTGENCLNRRVISYLYKVYKSRLKRELLLKIFPWIF